MRLLPLVLATALLAGCTAPTPPETPPGPSAGEPSGDPPGDGGPADTVDLGERFAHEHAAFSLWLAGERVSFHHPDYDLSRVRNMTAHLHVDGRPGGEHVIHVEGHFRNGVPDVTLADFFRVHGLDFVPGRVTLDTRADHNGTSWTDGEELRWQVWLHPMNGTWAEVPDGPSLRLRDGHRVLVTYAPPGADLDAQFRSVPHVDHRGAVVRQGEP